eukprot:2054175-Prymnesium_polylepis.1
MAVLPIVARPLQRERVLRNIPGSSNLMGCCKQNSKSAKTLRGCQAIVKRVVDRQASLTLQLQRIDLQQAEQRQVIASNPRAHLVECLAHRW